MSTEDPHLLSQIFDERGLLLTFFGALGGAVRAAALKSTWRDGMRVTFIGAATAFGVGVLSPVVLKPWIGDISEGLEGTLGVLCASAFILGLIAVTLIERWTDGKAASTKAGEVLDE